jgi:hypothetical protein
MPIVSLILRGQVILRAFWISVLFHLCGLLLLVVLLAAINIVLLVCVEIGVRSVLLHLTLRRLLTGVAYFSVCHLSGCLARTTRRLGAFGGFAGHVDWIGDLNCLLCCRMMSEG